MLANCCAVSPVSLSIVGARAPSMVRWKNESHEHAAIARHGTHICQVTVAFVDAGTATGLAPVDIRRPSRLFRIRQNEQRLQSPSRHESSAREGLDTPVRRLPL